MSLERRRELVRIAAERELLVLEDNPYGLLRYEGSPLPTLRSLDDEFVIYASTFSKILSPGVRLGWAVAPAPVLEKMNIGKQSSDLCSSSISQYFVGAYFDSGPWEDYVRSLIEIYRRRRDVMLDALAEHFPREAEWTHPQGGLFIWATLPGLHRHDRPAGPGARGAGRVRPGPRRVRRRPRRLVDAAELLRRRRGRDPRGRSAGSARSFASRSRCTARSPGEPARSGHAGRSSTGASRARRSAADARASREPLANVLRLPRKRA